MHFPTAPPEPDTSAEVLYLARGINFDFYFSNREAAQEYADEANAFYGLGEICKVHECRRKA